MCGECGGVKKEVKGKKKTKQEVRQNDFHLKNAPKPWPSLIMMFQNTIISRLREGADQAIEYILDISTRRCCFFSMAFIMIGFQFHGRFCLAFGESCWVTTQNFAPAFVDTTPKVKVIVPKACPDQVRTKKR